MQCKYCAYFKYERQMYLFTNSPPITQGRCTYHAHSFGNMTLSVTESCKHFREQEYEYQVGDVLKNDNEVVFIIGIHADYYPRCYRIRNHCNGEMSRTAEELSGYELIFRKGANGKENEDA